MPLNPNPKIESAISYFARVKDDAEISLNACPVDDVAERRLLSMEYRLATIEYDAVMRFAHRE
jgi:hypothetical protein